jgi:hypothetical protein
VVPFGGWSKDILPSRLAIQTRMIRRSNCLKPLRLGVHSLWLSLLVIFSILSRATVPLDAQTGTTAPPLAGAKDSITLSNGDTLTGKVGKVAFGNLSFHSDMLGALTIPINKIKAMHTATAFAAAATTDRLSKKTLAEQVPVGPVSVENATLTVLLPEGKTRQFPLADLSFMLDQQAFQRELHDQTDPWYGWYGTVTLGASLVTSTNNAQTYTGTVGLVRAIPTIAGLPAGSKTILNLSGTYGLATDPEIVSGGTVYQTASTSKTDILHGDLEYDKFFTPVVFGLVSSSADHNFGNGLQLQQAYGAGVGWAILRTPQNDLAVRTSLHYEQQQFYNGITSGLGTPTENLIGASVGETWSKNFKHNIKFNESLTLSPTFNVIKAYSGIADAGFLFPVYKNLNFSVTTSDNYLGDPPEGFLRNTFQFTTGVTYTLK